jgi:hypothetical protein
MHPAKKITTIYEYPPDKPKTGWRVWRDPDDYLYHVQLWLDGKLVKSRNANNSYKARCEVFLVMKTMDEETKKKIKLHEIFNEAM